MTDAVLTFRELLDYTAAENDRWHGWLAANPLALDVPYGAAPLTTVRDVARHVAFVEQRYAAIIAGEDVPAAPTATAESPDELFAFVARNRQLFEAAVAGARMDRTIEFMTLTVGRQRATARKIVAHALMHGIRHWAQVATVLREQGHRTDWPHDLLMSRALG